MPSGSVVHRFGPFELDPASRQLFHAQKRVRLSAPQSAILTLLVSKVGTIVPTETLIDAGWGGMAITENSLRQTISRLRKVLDTGRKGTTYIETFPQEGYRFTAQVQQATRDGADASLELQLAPYRAFLRGWTELATLNRDAIPHARHAFEEVLRAAPDYTRAHIGMAMACALAFEATTPDVRRDTASLEIGIRHAREACALAATSAEAWSALAFLLDLNQETEHAAAAACKAANLERENWKHALLIARVTWGEERLSAARRVLALCPGLALAHWLRTTVFIARGAFDAALEELRIGCAAQDAQTKGAVFPAVGLHLLHGLVLAAHDRLDEAATAFRRELSCADSGHLYARECAANTWYALGAVLLRQRKRKHAEDAFTRVLTIAPGHVSAAAVLRGEAASVLSNPASAFAEAPADKKTGLHRMDAALSEAIVLARGNRHADAARVYREAVAQMPPGPAGWLLPVEPLLHPLAHREIWADALAMIRIRAT
jgi:DNA-binding winged helix-turn-helix (wHTH) protein/Tfp pilus assembly protein PilF